MNNQHSFTGRLLSLAITFPLLTGVGLDATAVEPVPRQTTVRIVGDDFQINNQPTYAGRMWKGHRIEAGSDQRR